MYRAFKDRPLIWNLLISRASDRAFSLEAVRCSFLECCRVVWCDYLHCFWSALREKREIVEEMTRQRVDCIRFPGSAKPLPRYFCVNVADTLSLETE